MDNNTTQKTKAVLPGTDLQAAFQQFQEACELYKSEPSPEAWRAVEITRDEYNRIQQSYQSANMKLLVALSDRMKR